MDKDRLLIAWDFGCSYIGELENLKVSTQSHEEELNQSAHSSVISLQHPVIIDSSTTLNATEDLVLELPFTLMSRITDLLHDHFKVYL